MNTTPPDYSINIQNHSRKPRKYFCWPARPFITPFPEGGVYRCIQIAADRIPAPKGSVMFSLNMKPFAVTGTSVKPLAHGVKVEIRDSKRVQICTMDGNGDVVDTSTGNAYGAALGEGRKGCETLGSFAIEVGTEGQDKSGESLSLVKVHGITCFLHEPPYQNQAWSAKTIHLVENVFIGLGAPHPNYHGEVVPVACFLAQPGTNTVITPLAKFYVGEGDRDLSRVFDPQAVKNPLVIDFMSRAATRAWVVHNEHERWEVHYS